ncbi:MAG: LptE family protein [Gemmatimonadota bacterium]
MSNRFSWAAAKLVLCLFVAGCNYTFQAGAGFPPHVSTIAVSPFENDTGRFELSQEVYDIFLEELPSAFGLRVVSEEYADAIVRGSIRSYSVDAPSYRPASGGQRAEVVERRVTMTVHVQVIDRANNLILWDNTSLSARGEYAEATELEEDGRRTALDRLAQAVIDGIQSNW